MDLDQTAQTSPNAETSGRYYVHFYTRHPADKLETDPDARWWPEWHKYSTAPDGTIDYGDQYLTYPTRTPDATKCIAWADVVHLADPSTRLLGPFNFQDPCCNPKGRSPSFRQIVPETHWTELAAICSDNGIQPPRLVQLASPPQPK